MNDSDEKEVIHKFFQSNNSFVLKNSFTASEEISWKSPMQFYDIIYESIYVSYEFETHGLAKVTVTIFDVIISGGKRSFAHR